MEDLIKKNFFLIGLLSTLNALMIQVGGSQYTCVNFFIALLIILQLLYKKNIVVKKSRLLIIGVFAIFLISTLGSFFFIDIVWAKSSLRVAVKLIIFIAPLLLLFTDEELIKYRNYFFKGLLFSSYIQLFWEFLQLAAWNLFKFSINEFIFGKLLYIRIESHSWTTIVKGALRPSGVSWEPANLSLALVVGFILCNNKIVKLLFSIGILLSTSRTGILVWGIIMFIYAIKWFIDVKPFNNYSQKSIDNYKTKLISFFAIKRNRITVITLIFIFVFLIYIFRQPISKLFEPMFLTIQRLTISGQKTDRSALTHAKYYTEALNVLKQSNLFQIIFGYGTGIAGYPYTHFYNMYPRIIGWTPESDLISILIGNGVVGFVLYYGCFLTALFYNKNDNKAVMLLIATLLGGIFYIYYRFTWPFLILLFLFVKNKDASTKLTDNI